MVEVAEHSVLWLSFAVSLRDYNYREIEKSNLHGGDA